MAMDTRPDPLQFYETAHWRVVLNTNQTYLGRSVVLLKRPCGQLADVTDAEFSELLTVIRKLEHVFHSVLGATMFNWSCLMNFAYRDTVPNPQIHWHLVPRYDHTVEFAGRSFSDPNFGNRSKDDITTLPDGVLPELRNTLIKNLQPGQ